MQVESASALSGDPTKSPTTDEVESYTRLANGARVLCPILLPEAVLNHITNTAAKLVGITEPSQFDMPVHRPDTLALAEALKNELDNKWGKYWHVIAGTNFGSHVPFETGNFVYFVLGSNLAILAYKYGCG